MYHSLCRLYKKSPLIKHTFFTLLRIMEKYFNIRYEFNKKDIHNSIAMRLCQDGSDYICVSDGNILNMANKDGAYLDIINGGMFSICDSSYVPLYLKWIYGIKREQYSGSEIFLDIIKSRKYRMIFLGTKQDTLNSLKTALANKNPDVESMTFKELPFMNVEDFDYPCIAEMIENDNADIIWIALGAPKQERFMANLKPFLSHGVMIAIGAAFNFYSGQNIKRAPDWMVRNHLEFCYRIISEPKKQLKRCLGIIASLPRLLLSEYKIKRNLSFLPPNKI